MDSNRHQWTPGKGSEARTLRFEACLCPLSLCLLPGCYRGSLQHSKLPLEMQHRFGMDLTDARLRHL